MACSSLLKSDNLWKQSGKCDTFSSYFLACLNWLSLLKWVILHWCKPIIYLYRVSESKNIYIKKLADSIRFLSKLYAFIFQKYRAKTLIVLGKFKAYKLAFKRMCEIKNMVQGVPITTDFFFKGALLTKLFDLKNFFTYRLAMNWLLCGYHL